MSSEKHPHKPESRTGTNKRKRSNLGDDFLSVDSLSPSKRVLRSATATPVKIPDKVEDLSIRIKKRKDSKKKFTPKLSPAKTVSNARSLPSPLMDPKDAPTSGKITSYSKPEKLVKIVKILRGTKFLEALKKSPLGSLFKLPACKVALSGKLVRTMLCRMLPTRKRHEIWFLVANRPVRFSLKEFALVTGLPCGPYPTDSYFAECKSLKDSNHAYWNKLMVGSLKRGYLKDIENLLWKDPKLKEERSKLSSTTKMRLCLVLLVDGVLCPTTSTKMASRFTVEAVKDVGMFMKYPWGRESFELTLEMVRVNSQSTKSREDMVKKLKKSTHVLVKGLTIAFQLLFFEAVPAFSEIMFEDNEDDDRSVANSEIRELEQSRYFDNKRIDQIVNDPNTEVISLLDKGFEEVEGVDFSWNDEVPDPLVDSMVDKIKEGFHFMKLDWGNPMTADVTKAGTSRTRQNRASRSHAVDTSKVHAGKNNPPKSTVRCDESGFAYDPENQVQAYFYPVLRKQTDEKNQRDVDDNELTLLKNLKHLCERTEADNRVWVDEGIVQSSDTKVSSDHSASESINQRRKVDEKRKGKSPMLEDEDEGDDVVSDSDPDQFIREMAGDTSNIPIAQATQTDAIQKISSASKDSFEALCDERRKGQSEEDTFLRDMAGNTVDVRDQQEPLLDDQQETLPVVIGVQANPSDTPTHEDTYEEPTKLLEDSAAAKGDENMLEEGGEDIENEPEPKEKNLGATIGGGLETEVLEDIYVTKEKNPQPELAWEDVIKFGEASTGYPNIVPAKDVVPEQMGIMKVSATPTPTIPGASPVPDGKIKALQRAVASLRSSHYLLNNIQVPKYIFREIAAPKQHVSNNHIELMVGFLWDRFSKEFTDNRVLFLGTGFCQFIKTASENFQNKMGSDFSWNENLISIVNGTFAQSEMRTKWIVDVDRVYAPMTWDDNHWVGLCIELTTGTVTVLDSAYQLTPPAKADELMAPILDMLPLMIGDLTAGFEGSYTPPAVFVYQRPVNVPQDPSLTGNSGPLSVKYMELHSQGIPFVNLTDKMVENIRMNFAVDVFEQFQFPLI